MEVWVDLPVIQWAYGHSQQFEVPGEWDGKIGSGLEKAFRFKIAKRKDNISGCVTRYRPDSRYMSYDTDRQILVDFDDEEAYTWFMLRWT